MRACRAASLDSNAPIVAYRSLRWIWFVDPPRRLNMTHVQDCEYPNLCTRILGFLGEEARSGSRAFMMGLIGDPGIVLYEII